MPSTAATTRPLAHFEPRTPFLFNRFAIGAAQLKHRLDILALHGVADRIFAERPDPFGKHAGAALELDPMDCRELAGRSKEHGVEHFFPRVDRVRSSLGQSGYQIGETKHLVEIGLKLAANHGAIVSPSDAETGAGSDEQSYRRTLQSACAFP